MHWEASQQPADLQNPLWQDLHCGSVFPECGQEPLTGSHCTWNGRSHKAQPDPGISFQNNGKEIQKR